MFFSYVMIHWPYIHILHIQIVLSNVHMPQTLIIFQFHTTHIHISLDISIVVQLIITHT
jgi:hypothetical protein